MGYKALYRSYRPTTFKEVIGQKHVIQTLKNAIIENRTSHAYVFSGLRGIGKTTIARILAKAVNCQNPIDGEPCNECENCKAINEKITTDVVELDAASNNGVDEIRSLLEKVNFLPSFLSKKVYIIDEVHMLSTAAFNALLKTLEEPPAYVMFILATTEPHKIPMTILSRCQRFDFKQFTIEELTQELVYICEKENIQITKEALNGIAEAAEGGMRDALSILDQASVYAEGEITVEDVNNVTGNISNQKIIELLNALNNDDATTAISNINELLNMGKEVSRLITNVIQFCRDLLLYKSVNEAPKDKYIYSTEAFKELVEETDSKRLFYYIDVLVDVQNKIRFTNSQKIYLEVGIMKIVNSASEDINLLGRIQELEYRLENGEGVELSGSYPSNNSSFEQRLSTIENKIKKLQNEIEKANINGFKETINSKISVLEDVVSKTSALPNTIEQRITILENRLEDVENGDYENNTQNEVVVGSNTQIDSSLKDKIEKIEKDLNDYIVKTNAILTAVVEDLENVKGDDVELSDPVSSVNDDVILELIDKITQIEDKLANIQNVNVPVENYSSDLSAKVNALTETVNSLKNKVEVIYNKGYAEVSFQSLFDVDVPAQNNDLADAVNELIQEFNLVKEEIEKIKAQGDTHFSLYNKDKENDSNIELLTGLVKELEYKVNELEQKIINLSTPSTPSFSNQNNDAIANQIAEIKTNYFVLTQALTLMKEKYDNLQIGGIPQPVIAQIENIENTLKTLRAELDELKACALKDGALNQTIETIRVLESGIKELENKLNQVLNKSQSIVQKEEKVEIVENVVKEEPVVEAPVPQEVKVETITPVKSELIEVDLTAEIYNIKVIENILHEARLPECKNVKNQLMSAWSNLEDKVGAQLMYVAKILSNGLLVANGKTHLIIVYPNAQLCNHIMTPKHYENAKEVLKVGLGKAYDFVALPDDTWKEKRLEYHDKFRVGDVYPVLSPINNPKLRVVVRKESPKSEREIAIEKANDFFGEDED
ncbi:MAG: DNA polymerase III subunit gamma/tau [Bacilli bacterium]|nr:DNA polymerase III subunit gamma/tau [Bacilli bacterium]